MKGAGMMAKTTVTVQAWSIRGYEPGDYYATVFCPHGKPVEVINTDKNGDAKGDPIDPAKALEEWLAETAEWRDNYCEH